MYTVYKKYLNPNNAKCWCKSDKKMSSKDKAYYSFRDSSRLMQTKLYISFVAKTVVRCKT